MQRWILLCFGTAFATSAFALPTTCVTGTYASYVSLGATGCQDGNATFNNFGTLGFTNSGGVSTIPTSDIIVIPGGTALDPTLRFEYGTLAASVITPAPETVNVAGQIFSMGFAYQIAFTEANLSSIQMGETFSNTTSGSVSATKNAQIASGPVFTSTVTDGGVSNSANTTLAGNLATTSGTGIWTITDTVSLQAQTGSATQNSFENLYSSAAATSVPEPSTMLIAAAVLLGLGMVRRRRRSADL